MLDFLTLDPVPTVAGTVGCARPIHVLDDAALREHAAGGELRVLVWRYASAFGRLIVTAAPSRPSGQNVTQ